MISKEEFFERCDKLIPQDALDEIDRISRKKKIAMIWSVIIIGAVVVASAIWFAIKCCTSMGTIADIEDVLFLIFVIGATFLMTVAPISLITGGIVFFMFVKYTSEQQNFLKRYNDVIVSCLLQDYDHYYSHTEYIDEEIFQGSPFNVYEYNTYTGEDLLAIKIPDDNGQPLETIFQCSDLRVSYKKSPHFKSDEDKDVYLGLMGYVEFPFEFGCNLSINNNSMGLPRISLEDVEFNKRFQIYTDNRLEALVILTTSFMQRLVKYSKKFPRSKIVLTRDGRMYFSIARNLFEARVWKSKSKHAMFEGYYEDIENILALINEIKNNDKLFRF